jgi:5-methylcytosine-specific restriction endonuclease McrA
MTARMCARHGLYAGHRCPFCENEAAERAAARPRTVAQRVRSTQRWKRTRERILNRDGHRCTFGLYLEDDAQGVPGGWCKAKKKIDVHHRVPIEDDGDPYDDDNLRTLCKRHHEIDERAYRQRKEERDEDNEGEAAGV